MVVANIYFKYQIEIYSKDSRFVVYIDSFYCGLPRLFLYFTCTFKKSLT